MDQYFETAVQSDEIGKFLGAIRDCEIDRYTTLLCILRSNQRSLPTPTVLRRLPNKHSDDQNI